MIPYDIQTINSPNPLVRFSHRARINKCLALVNDVLPFGGALLDFGAGPGMVFLGRLLLIRADAKYYAIDPLIDKNNNPISCITDFNSLPSNMDIITSFETCEHLTDAQLTDFLNNSEKYLKDTGKLIVSVPIMNGLVLPAKEISRIFATKKSSDYSILEMIKGVFGMTVQRALDRNASHKGFDFRRLRKKINNHFVVEGTYYYPLNAPWWLNSQAVFVCRKKSLSETIVM